MKKFLFKKSFLIALSLIIAFFGVFNAPASASTSEKNIKTIQDSLRFNVQTERYVFNADYAQKNGLTEKQAANLKEFFEGLDEKQIKSLNEEVGFAPDYSAKNNNTHSVAPALLVVLGFIGGAAATKLLDEIMNYGIKKACQKNKGKWGVFDDYCKTNGHA